MALGLHLSVLKPLVGTHPKHSHIKSEYALIPVLAFCSSVRFCPRPWSFLQTAKGFSFLWVFFPALFSFSSLSGHISPRACPAPPPPRPPQALRVPLWILAEGNFGRSKSLRFPLTLSWFSARAQEGVRCGICFLEPWKRTPCSALGVFKERFKQRTR